MTATLILPAPAKLNLFLHVTGRRPNGYHTLQTVFQLLDHGDELSFTCRQDGQLQLLESLPGVPDHDNLVLRAARALQQASGTGLGADIGLLKRLPAGGGLGGGSSDAATTLLGLNCLWQLDLSIDTLADIGLTLGADVPVFVRGSSGWAEGVGEVLTPVELPPKWYLVIAPSCAVSTAEIFAHPDLTRDSAPITIAAFLAGGGRNDCEPIARRLHPEVGVALEWLGHYAPARMTGTGACVFAGFDQEPQARYTLSQVPGHWRSFVARGVNHSPLHQRLQALTSN